jgi:effector-binding domain-containing protein
MGKMKTLTMLICLSISAITFSQGKSTLGEITVEKQEAMTALVADGAGTMETIGQQLGELYGLLFMEVGSQQLEVAGPPFVHYLDFDEATGHSNYKAGMPVAAAGKDAGKVKVVEYPEMKVVRAMHTGAYEEFVISYGKMDEYIKSNKLEVTGQAFEFYLTDPGSEPDNSKWQTLICFPLK